MTLQPFTPVPATRAVGTVNPSGDMNNTSLELAAMGGSFSVLNTAYAGGADSSAGTLLTGSADTASKLTAAGGQSMSLTTPQSLAAGTFVWVAFLENLATTQPQLRTFGALSASAPNVNLANATARVALNGTGLTSLPASITPSSNSITNAAIWVGIS